MIEHVALPLPAEGLSLLGAYEDSDDEDAGDSLQHSTAKSTDIDSTLANFMAVSIICCTS